MCQLHLRLCKNNVNVLLQLKLVGSFWPKVEHTLLSLSPDHSLLAEGHHQIQELLTLCMQYSICLVPFQGEKYHRWVYVKTINMVIKLFDPLFHFIFLVMKDGRKTPHQSGGQCKWCTQGYVTTYVLIVHGVKSWGFKTLHKVQTTG
jgi:hypothetical protein